MLKFECYCYIICNIFPSAVSKDFKVFAKIKLQIEQSKGMARKDVSHSYFKVCPHEVYRILKFVRKELFILYGYKHKSVQNFN